MRRAILAAAFAGCAVAALPAQQPRKFTSGIDLVRVDALVTDGHSTISGLTASDFELRDNGVPQSIDSVLLESLPLSVTFVLDTSGSVNGIKLFNLERAVGVVLDRLRDEDMAALITFSHRVRLARALTSDRAAIRDTLHGVAAAGTTALRDAVYTGLALSGREHTRSLVLAFSDGIDNASWLSEGIVQRAAERSDAVVYGVAVAETPEMPGRKARYARGQTDFLEAIATLTGGRLLRADTGDVTSAFGEVLAEFRTRYLITYSPARVAASGWHSIELTVKGRRAVVTARRGYER